MKKTLFALMLAAAAAAVSAQTLVTVNGKNIDSKEVDVQVAAIRQQSNNQVKDSPELRQSILNRLVVHNVIVQEARRLKLEDGAEYKKIVSEALADAKKTGEDKKPEFKQNLEIFKENLLEQAYSVYILEKQPVTDAEVNKEYNEMKAFYAGSQEVQLAEIVTRSKAAADKAHAELKSGKKFADVAGRYTIDEEGKKNGGMHEGYINLKDLAVGAPPVHAAVSKLSKGQYTDVIAAGEIYTIFMVSDKRNATIPPLTQKDAAGISLKDRLTAGLQEERIGESIEKLVQKATITPKK